MDRKESVLPQNQLHVTPVRIQERAIQYEMKMYSRPIRLAQKHARE